jgi:hypothetical protein
MAVLLPSDESSDESEYDIELDYLDFLLSLKIHGVISWDNALHMLPEVYCRHIKRSAFTFIDKKNCLVLCMQLRLLRDLAFIKKIRIKRRPSQEGKTLLLRCLCRKNRD